ncbi:hypothetical protein [Lacunimicrobium album]
MPSEQRAFARQAIVDLKTFEILNELHPLLPSSEKYVMLQMACEKLCKSFLLFRSSAYGQSHLVCQKQFSAIARFYDDSQGRRITEKRKAYYRSLELIGREIDFLSPANRGILKSLSDSGAHGQWTRDDNCEYPWQIQPENFVAPCEYSFPTMELLFRKNGIGFFKFLRSVLDLLVNQH